MDYSQIVIANQSNRSERPDSLQPNKENTNFSFHTVKFHIEKARGLISFLIIVIYLLADSLRPAFKQVTYRDNQPKRTTGVLE